MLNYQVLDRDDTVIHALNIVTAMASNPNCHLEPNQETAEKIAEFVATLVDKLSSPKAEY